MSDLSGLFAPAASDDVNVTDLPDLALVYTRQDKPFTVAIS